MSCGPHSLSGARFEHLGGPEKITQQICVPAARYPGEVGEAKAHVEKRHLWYQNQEIATEIFYKGQVVLCSSVIIPFPWNSRSDLWISFVGHIKLSFPYMRGFAYLYRSSCDRITVSGPTSMLRWAVWTPSPFGKVLTHFRFAGTPKNTYLLGS